MVVATGKTGKGTRFEMRLSQEQRERLDEAARLKGMSTSQWALMNLLDAADRDVREAHVIRLSEQGWRAFNDALDDEAPVELVRLLESEPIWR